MAVKVVTPMVFFFAHLKRIAKKKTIGGDNFNCHIFDNLACDWTFTVVAGYFPTVALLVPCDCYSNKEVIFETLRLFFFSSSAVSE